MSAAVIAADREARKRPSGVSGYSRFGIDLASPVYARRGECPQFAGSVPARHVIEVQLHEFLGHGQGLRLVTQLENGVATDHFLGLDEGAIDHAELAADDAHTRA